MSGAPPSLIAVRGLLHTATGLPFVSLGIVGNTKHVRGYHLGRDRIYDGAGPGIGDADYSVKTARDKAGLSDYASAIDVGNFPRLRHFSQWIVNEARHNAPDTRDFREIIYSPDGVHVYRWDRERGYASAPRTGEADQSHTTHTHFSTYRDSHDHSLTGVFARYFAPVPKPSEEVVNAFEVYERRAYVTLRLGAKLYDSSSMVANAHTITIDGPLRVTDAQREVVYIGKFTDAIRIVSYEPPGAPDADVVSSGRFVHATDLIGAVRFADDLNETIRHQIRLGAFGDATEAIKRLA